MKRGEVYLADLAPRSGSEQQGRRPAIVLSHDSFNREPNWRSVIVVPLSTSQRQARRGPTAVALPRGAGGLQRDSVALCHQVTTVDRSKLLDFLGVLPDDLLGAVDEGLKIALDLH
ncbi:MAG: type II toxin-antitoxin system PemK/MazF family toxin [Trueperaceae bacterium]